MRRIKYNLYAITFMISCLQGTGLAQPYIYYMTAPPNSNSCTLGQLDLSTCQRCDEFTIPCGNDLVALPNGQVLVASATGFSIYDPPSSTPVSTYTIPGGPGIAPPVVLTPNGTVYFFTFNNGGNGLSCLNEYDPATNTSIVIGCAPPPSSVLIQLFFWNGELYAIGSIPGSSPQQWGLYTIGIGDPLVLTLIETYAQICSGPIAAVPGVGIFSSFLLPLCANSSTGFENYDVATNTAVPACDLGDNIYGLSYIPPGFPPPSSTCLCDTEAGAVSPSNLSLCIDEDFDFSSSGSDLEADDILQFILFSNLADTLGSILLTSNSSSFSFSQPPLTAGVTYYVAAIAGNELPSGNVDLTDPCLDISNVIEVQWNPFPTVGFSAASPDVCAGECLTFNVTFTGIPPYSLTYIAGSGPPLTQIFTANTGTLEVCPPAGAPSGAVTLSTVSLIDANCVCD
jgi:hypothetical protein